MSMENDLLDDGMFDEDDEDTLKGRYLTFSIGKEDYGIAIEYVTEIVGIQNITEVPDMPSFVKGVMNLRGRVIPVIDVRLRFKLDERDYDDRTCTIVVAINDTAIGLIVDIVKEVINIPEENISAAPTLGKSESSRYIEAMGRVDEDVKILLDVQKLLYEKEMAIIEEAVSS